MTALAPMLATLHAWAATAAAVIAGLLVVLGALDGFGVIRAKRWLDRLLLALIVAVVVASLLGPGIVAGLRPPSDPLHFVYAATALAVCPLLRWAAARRGAARTGWWVAVGGLVTLGALLRLWATG